MTNAIAATSEVLALAPLPNTYSNGEKWKAEGFLYFALVDRECPITIANEITKQFLDQANKTIFPNGEKMFHIDQIKSLIDKNYKEFTYD